MSSGSTDGSRRRNPSGSAGGVRRVPLGLPVQHRGSERAPRPFHAEGSAVPHIGPSGALPPTAPDYLNIEARRLALREANPLRRSLFSRLVRGSLHPGTPGGTSPISRPPRTPIHPYSPERGQESVSPPRDTARVTARTQGRQPSRLGAASVLVPVMGGGSLMLAAVGKHPTADLAPADCSRGHNDSRGTR